EEIHFPAALKSIGGSAFAGDQYCGTLTNIELPERLESIGSYAFKKRINMESIYIPASVTSIADDAFEGCGEFTIRCHPNTYALAYARKHSIRFERAEMP
ncbi:MAG: leucine-rich repeat domain-containing protein, partial [Eubacteriales bacterium]|nr:leucine-rich repeat domain-containing protein [Eubacteriales bacterium]